jgi:DNA-binding NarL/FixJ family response regulator
MGNVVSISGDEARPRSLEQTPGPIGVLIAHGQRLARAGLRLLIDTDDSLAVVGEAATGEHAVGLARRRRPRIVVVDLGLPGLDALEATRQIVADPALSGVRVLVLTPADRDESILGPLRAGARGLIVSDGEPEELLFAIRRLAAGEAPISASLMHAVITDVASRPEPPRSDATKLSELTDREREVVALAALGLSNREIAQYLVISPATSRTHVSRAMRKLDARDRAQLVVIAYQTGLATPGATSPEAPAGVRPIEFPGPRERFGERLPPTALVATGERAAPLSHGRTLAPVGA